MFVEAAQRRIPVQYAKRVVGRRVMGGQIFVSCRCAVNSGGVIPPIFASSPLLAFPPTIALLFAAQVLVFDERREGHQLRVSRSIP